MISFRNVHKSFSGREVLKGISFEVPEGQILFILGTSGTGKSVLLKTIVGLLKPTSGEILIENQDITRLTEKQLFPVRRKCGMVFQQPALFDSLTIYENVAFGLRKHQPELQESAIAEKVRECLALVHLKDIEGKKPQDISFGMQKRVSLARTVAVARAHAVPVIFVRVAFRQGAPEASARNRSVSIRSPPTPSII